MRLLLHVRRSAIRRWAVVCAVVMTAWTGTVVAKAWNRRDQVNLAYQIALSAADFSPGILDGQFGPNSQMALRQYTKRFFPGDNPYNASNSQVYAALHVDVKHAVASYTIAPQDAALVGAAPNKWQQMAKLRTMPYRSLRDCICEKFHCTAGLLRRLNPGVSLRSLTAGQTLRVPNIQPFPVAGPLPEPSAATFAKPGAAASVVIDEGKKTIRVFDAAHQQIALFHCSVAQHRSKLPVGRTVIKVMALNPDYTFNPKEWTEVHGVHRVLIIPPGPRNPVGLCWMGLDLPGYGMHGNAYPQNIGHTGSHGCFRLTNWDALTLFSLVRVGTPVKFIDNPLHQGHAGGSSGALARTGHPRRQRAGSGAAAHRSDGVDNSFGVAPRGDSVSAGSPGSGNPARTASGRASGNGN